jgi:hypothetical protein
MSVFGLPETHYRIKTTLELISKLRSATQPFAPCALTLRLCVKLIFSQRRKVKAQGAKEDREWLCDTLLDFQAKPASGI